MKVGFFLCWILSYSSSYAGLRHLQQSLPAPIPIEIKFQLETTPLTTRFIVERDPQQKNPYRMSWFLDRRTEFLNLQAVRGHHHRFQVQLAEAKIVSEVRGYIRPSSEDEKNQNNVSELEGRWSQLLRNREVQLRIFLNRIRASTADQALQEGYQFFQQWLERVDREWRESPLFPVFNPAAPVQKNFYSPPPEGEKHEILARLPVRRWNGVFTVRLTLQIGQQRLNGRFLIDFGSPRSVISPQWLEEQGLSLGLLSVSSNYDRTLSSFFGGGLWGYRQRFGQSLRVDGVSMGGVGFQFLNWMLLDTAFFSPPDYVGFCCDGVLGADFFRSSIVEFVEGPPIELIFWKDHQFSWTSEARWLDLSETPEGHWLSACTLQSGEKLFPIQWLHWDLGSFISYQSVVKFPQSPSELKCDDRLWVQQLSPWESVETLPFLKAAISVGMPGLIFKKNIVFDFLNGRVGFPYDLTQRSLYSSRLSRLKVKYSLVKGERVLQLVSIPESLSQSFLEVGFSLGSVITHFNSVPVEELDLWDIEEQLRTRHEVYFTWQSAQGSKTAGFQGF